MGRPKKQTSPKPPEDSPAVAPDGRVAIIHLKGSPEYASWLEDLHRQTHIAKATLFRVAMAEYAKAHGHPAPPEI